MNEEYALIFLGIIAAPVVGVGIYMIKSLGHLCERIARLEAKAEIYHPTK